MISQHSLPLYIKKNFFPSLKLHFFQRSVDFVSGGPDYSTLTYILPQFSNLPDLVIGHIGGIKMTIPYEMKAVDRMGQVIRAPEVGEWYVLEAQDPG